MIDSKFSNTNRKVSILITSVAIGLLAMVLLISLPTPVNINNGYSHQPIRPIRTPSGRLLRNRHDQLYSSNWSGYAVAKYITNQNYTSASSQWVVPSVNASSTYINGYSSSWVGIGGYCLNSNCKRVDKTLIQLGTEQDYTTSGTKYYAWYETLPQSETRITGFAVNPGDTITASLNEITGGKVSSTHTKGGGGNHQSSTNQVWQLTLQDTNTNETWSKQISYNSSLASAEWIEEAPYSGGILPLADYGVATFDPGTANNSNPDLINSDGIIMENSNGQTSNPSNPDIDIDGFNTCWGAGTNLTICSIPSS